MKNLEITLHAYLGAWNAHDLEGVVSFYDLEYEGQDVGQAHLIRGQEGARRVIAAILKAFPDLVISTGEPLIQGERVAVDWSLYATQQGPVMNIPATLRQVQVRGISILTVKEGLIRHASHVWDVAGLLRSLGLLPDL